MLGNKVEKFLQDASEILRRPRRPLSEQERAEINAHIAAAAGGNVLCIAALFKSRVDHQRRWLERHAEHVLPWYVSPSDGRGGISKQTHIHKQQ